MSLFDFVLGLIKKTGAEPSISHTWDLGSGYSVSNDRKANAAKLMDLCNQAVSDPKFNSVKLPDGTWQTYCNEGSQFILNGVGCHDLDGLTANQMASKLQSLIEKSNTGWILEDQWSRATSQAQKGGIALFIWDNPNGHGHVCVVSPEPMQQSGSWGCLVPMVASIGEVPPNKNAILRLSQSFLLADKLEIKCYLYGEV